MDKKAAFLEELTARVKNEITEILNKANLEKDRVLTTAKRKAEHFKTAPLAELKELEMAVLSVRPRKKGKKINVEAIHLVRDNIDSVFDQAEQDVSGLTNSPRYGKSLKGLFDEALDGLEGDIVLFTNEKDSVSVKKMASDMLNVEFRTDNSIIGGLVAMSDNGRVKNLNTLSSRFERAKRFTIKDLNRILYAQ